MNAPAALPRLAELPIPVNAQPGPGWTEQMLEMAAHIGAYPTLCIVDQFGGQQIYVAKDASSSPFRDVVTDEIAATIASVYGGNRLLIPVGRAALDRARRAGIIAAVREGKMTGADAQKIIGTSRTYVSHLVNQTNEGQDAEPVKLSRRHDPRQHDLFAAKSEE